jgi:hypothetical protein
MTNELIIQLFEHERERVRLEAELGALAVELARIAVELRELREALLPVALSAKIN